jgi:hypothetical protein
MKATIKNGILTIEIPVHEQPVLSSTKKTLLVANASGKTGLIVDGQQVTIGVNAYIKA